MKSNEILIYAKNQHLLFRKIGELPLRIESTHLENLIIRLYKELEMAGIVFKPNTYLSDNWGCPNEVPVIGIPFYLVDPVLCNLKTQMTGINSEDDMHAMMLLRHEVGHAFNYAYRLYEKPEWQELFGRFSLPYSDEYKIDPFSTGFVHHIPGCYAQKHPDDDFAETFAVWLSNSNWKKTYADTPALVKLLYINKIAARYGKKSPMVTGGDLDMPYEEILMTLGEWYEKAA